MSTTEMGEMYRWYAFQRHGWFPGRLAFGSSLFDYDRPAGPAPVEVGA